MRADAYLHLPEVGQMQVWVVALFLSHIFDLVEVVNGCRGKDKDRGW
jgi:hypothetical protein